MQAARNLVTASAELSARVQDGQNHCNGRNSHLWMKADRDAAPIVPDTDDIPRQDIDLNIRCNNLQGPHRSNYRRSRKQGGAGRADRLNRYTCRDACGLLPALPAPEFDFRHNDSARCYSRKPLSFSSLKNANAGLIWKIMSIFCEILHKSGAPPQRRGRNLGDINPHAAFIKTDDKALGKIL